jgi:hypothetical protein
MDYQQISTHSADCIKFFTIVFLVFIQVRDHIKNFFEAIVHQIVSFLNKVFVSDKDLVIAVYVRNSVNKFVLDLTS